MIKIKLLGSLLVYVLFTSTQLIAEQQIYYQIEMLCFEHTHSQRFNEEVWPQFVGNFDTAGALYLDPALITLAELNNSFHYNTHLPSLDKKEFLLQQHAKVIKRSNNYRFVMQKAWVQPLVAGKRSNAVYMQGGHSYRSLLSKAYDAVMVWEIEGLISFKPVHNLYHAELDLVYRLPPETKQAVNEFRITRKARLKVKDIYYFDHPIIGIILTLAPISIVVS